MKSVNAVFVRKLVAKHLIYVLTPCACAADYDSVTVVFSDSAYNALTITLYSACPCYTAVRLVADLVNNVIVVLVGLSHFCEELDSFIFVVVRVLVIENVPVDYSIHSKRLCVLNACLDFLLCLCLILAVLGAVATPFFCVHCNSYSVDLPVISQHFKRVLCKDIGEIFPHDAVS